MFEIQSKSELLIHLRITEMGPTEHILKFLWQNVIHDLNDDTTFKYGRDFFLLQNFGETDSILELTAM